MSKYGVCICGNSLKPVWFIEEETEIVLGYLTKTGRKRKAVDILVCPICFREYTVDGSFDEPWEKEVKYAEPQKGEEE